MVDDSGGETHNTIRDSSVWGPVLQGRDFGDVDIDVTIQAVAPVPVALAQLPASLPGFTGRAPEMATLTSLLNPAGSANTVVVSAVAGLAGVGKTALAVQAAHAALQSGWFPGGVLFINLHGYEETRVEPDEALSALLRALGTSPEHIPHGIDERAGLYRSQLAKRRDPVLLIADNAFSEAQVNLLMPGTGPHRVLVTSRHTLAGLHGRLLHVRTLNEEAGVALLSAALRAARPDDERVRTDRSGMERLARICGGLPLALQITAALLKADPTRMPSELAGQLSDEVEALNLLRYDDGSGSRAPSVEAAFELSYRQLDETAARVFRLLPVNPGPDLSTDAVSALANLPTNDVRSAISQLVKANLIEPAPGAPDHWRMHDLLRLYAKKLSDTSAIDDRREQAQGRLFRYYLANSVDELAQVIRRQVDTGLNSLLGASGGYRAANVKFHTEPQWSVRSDSPSEGDLTSLLVYYRSLPSGRLVILGEPGSGKTVLALELLIQFLRHRSQGNNTPIPVPINATMYESRMSLDEWLARNLVLQYRIRARVASALVRDGWILPIVDGIDEMGMAGEDSGPAELIRRLNQYLRGHQLAPVVVTCRTDEYQSFRTQVQDAAHIRILPLTGHEAAEYLYDQLRFTAKSEQWWPVLANLQNEPDGRLARQLSTPWLLFLAVTAFRSDFPADLLAPAQAESHNYAQMEGLLLGQYIRATTLLHGSVKHYDPQYVQQWLAHLAYGLSWQSAHHGSATDIRLDQWWRTVGGGITRRVHLLLAMIPGLLWLTIVAAKGNLLLAGIGGLLTLALGAAAGRSSLPNSAVSTHLAARHGRRRLVTSLTVGLIAGLALGLISGLSSRPWIGLPVTLIICLMIGIMGGLAAAMRQNLLRAAGPQDLIWKDGRYGLIAGLIIAFLAVFVIGITSRSWSWAMAGIPIGLTFGFTSVAKVWARYHIATSILFIRRQGPLQFSAFLRWAQQAGLLRTTGVSYQFRHRRLQDWLMSRR